jgi:oligopeptide transport system substrate-binding protein
MWKKELGVTAEPFNQEWKVYLKSQETKDYDISRSAWSGDYPDPSTFLELFLTDSGNNMTGWTNKNYDKVFAESNAMPYGDARNKHMAEAEALLLNEAPIAPLYVYTNFGFLRPEVTGFDQNLIDRPYIRYLSKK